MGEFCGFNVYLYSKLFKAAHVDIIMSEPIVGVLKFYKSRLLDLFHFLFETLLFNLMIY